MPEQDIALFSYYGEAAVDVGGGTYTGIEKLSYATVPEGPDQRILCEYTWDTVDWEHFSPPKGPNPVTIPCTEGDGTPCAFWFTLVASNGTETGGDCAAVFSTPPGEDGGDFSYGYVANYSYNGYDMGETLFYYSRANSSWSPEAYTAPPQFEGGPGSLVELDAGTFRYRWLQGYYFVDPPPADVVFAEDFETGNTMRWSSAVGVTETEPPPL